jgi:predicted Rossmann fold nucleotide-binding protein DprA/Smf involved in DNA uptake
VAADGVRARRGGGAVKVAVIGSRNFANTRLLADVLEEYRPTMTALVSGGARGADKLGERWANKHGIATEIFHPDHKRYKHAYHPRNRLIVEAADLVVAFWDGHSTGTAYTMGYAKRLGKPVRVVR